jgi:hypothetical protein
MYGLKINVLFNQKRENALKHPQGNELYTVNKINAQGTSSSLLSAFLLITSITNIEWKPNNNLTRTLPLH